MRTDNPTSGARALNRLRAYLSRARRVILAQPPLVRWSLAGAVMALGIATAYMAMPVATTYTAVYARLSPSDLNRLANELTAKQIRYRIPDGSDRLVVESAHYAEVQELLKKLDLQDHSLSDIRARIKNQASIFDNPGDRENRDNVAIAEQIETMIRGLDEIVSAFVIVNRPKPRLGYGSIPASNASVWVETVRDRPVSFKTVQSIAGYVTANVPEIKHDAVTLYDRKGRFYLNAKEPNVGQVNRIRAREEELGERIVEELSHIEGLQVTVQIVPGPQAPPQPAPAPPVVSRVEPEVGSSIVANQPIKLEPDPRPAPPPPVKPAPETETIRVWAKVPASYYRKHLKPTSGHKASLDDVQIFVNKTKKIIETAVAVVIPVAPGGEAPKVLTDTLPDIPANDEPLVPSNTSEPISTVPWWIPAGGAVAVAVVLSTAVGYRVVSQARRPSPHFVTSQERGTFKVDGASEPGPSERVRELIRLNPEAAASVLHRWTGQGGRVE